MKELEDYIGNCKFGIFFSTKGRRSVANEIGNGDFDGDLYWVSRNPQVNIILYKMVSDHSLLLIYCLTLFLPAVALLQTM